MENSGRSIDTIARIGESLQIASDSDSFGGSDGEQLVRRIESLQHPHLRNVDDPFSARRAKRLLLGHDRLRVVPAEQKGVIRIPLFEFLVGADRDMQTAVS